jgi:hypothetical protein
MRWISCLLGLVASFATSGAVAQSAAKPVPCQGAEARQFDFWVGRWEVFTPDGKKAGDNVIEPIDGGCALIERWTGRGGFTGTSLNSWDADARRWRQHWIDNQGGLLRLSGQLEGQRMVLGAAEPHPDKSGVMVRERISWTPQADGSVRQWWQRSDDEGSTWSTVFDGRYVRSR